MPLSDSTNLLHSAASVLARLERDESLWSALPLFALLAHVVVSVLGGLALGLMLKCTGATASRWRVFSYVMRMQKELQPTTLISAAALTVCSLAHPEPLELRCGLLLVIAAFAVVSVCVLGFAFLRFHLQKLRSERHALLAADVSIAMDDALTAFYLNGVYSSSVVLVLRPLMLICVLAATAAAGFYASRPAYAVLVSTALLFVLVLNAGADYLRPALITPGAPRWDNRDFMRAVQLRRGRGGGGGGGEVRGGGKTSGAGSSTCDSPVSSSKGAGRAAASELPIDLLDDDDDPSSASSGSCAGCTAGCRGLRGLASVLMPAAAREVVLRESTKLLWADQRFNNIGELAPSSPAHHGMDAASEV
jgi:hypothetical protein